MVKGLTNMHSLTVDSIKDFQICERLYDYRHNDRLYEKLYSRDILNVNFESTIKNILYFFWFKKQGGITPSYSSLLNRWEKLWYPKGTTAYDITHDKHSPQYVNMASLTTKAADILLRFHEKYSDADIIPIGISEGYSAIIGKSIRIEDKYDLIFKKDNAIYVVKFLFNHKSKNSFLYQIDFATMYLGFKLQHPGRLDNTKFGYINFMSNNFELIEYGVSDEDLDSLKYWANLIVDKKVFIPRRGLTSYCKQCQFDDPCSKWKFSNIEVPVNLKN